MVIIFLHFTYILKYVFIPYSNSKANSKILIMQSLIIFVDWYNLQKNHYRRTLTHNTSYLISLTNIYPR